MTKSAVVIALFASASVAAMPAASSAGNKAKDAARDAAAKDKKSEPKADCEFVEISATNAAQGKTDAELASFEKKLKKPPFSSWNTFKQLQRSQKTLAVLKSETVKLSTGSIAVLLRDVTTSKKTRFGLAVTMDDLEGKRVMDTKVSVDAGDVFLIARSLANNDGYVLALTCRLQ